MDLFREKHTPQTKCGPSHKQGVTLGETYSTDKSMSHHKWLSAASKCGVVSFYGLGNFIS